MQDIKDLSLFELEEKLKSWAESAFHARQILAWIYKKGIKDFSAMSDLSAPLRKKLADNFFLCSLRLADKSVSRDGTEKFLFELRDKNLIEAVSIPAETRVTGCISTQVGCKFACRFCASGVSGFKRNLTCAEMLEEVLQLRNNSASKRLTHLVFMGIGEPLDNYDNVLKVIRVINADYAFNIAARRITVSTCGIPPAIKKLAEEKLQIELSISLHAADDRVRSQIMPVNKKYPLKELLAACGEYVHKTKRQVTFEYILIRGLNSDLPSAQKLSRIMQELKLAKANLIPANPVKELGIEPPNKLEILMFRDRLLKSGVNVTLRKPRGQDIQAACGQLRLKYEKN